MIISPEGHYHGVRNSLTKCLVMLTFARMKKLKNVLDYDPEESPLLDLAWGAAGVIIICATGFLMMFF